MPRATLSLDAVVAVSLSSAECTSPALPGHYARRYQFAAAAGDSLSVELQTTGFEGFIRLDTVTASPPPTPYPHSFAETGECFGVAGDPCIHYLLLPATRDYVLESRAPGFPLIIGASMPWIQVEMQLVMGGRMNRPRTSSEAPDALVAAPMAAHGPSLAT